MSALIIDLSNELATYGGKFFAQMVNNAQFMDDVIFMRNVKTPVALPKLNINGEPRPYRADDDFAGNTMNITDRILTVHQSKWDFNYIDPEVLRNTYLAKVEAGALDPQKIPFSQFVTGEIVRNYMAAINDKTYWLGVRNAAGTTAASIFTGFGTMLADAITADEIEAIVTGAITDANAVSKIDTFHEELPAYMKDRETIIYCSWNVFEKYRRNYRAAHGFTFDPNPTGEYRLDGKRSTLVPRSWLGTSQRLVCVAAEQKNMYMGLDSDGVKLYPTIKHNLIMVRAMLPIGAQWADLSAVFCNDQA